MKIKSRSAESTEPASLFIKLFFTLFGLVFFAVGVGILVIVFRQSNQTISSYFWQSSICVIESSQILDDGGGESPYSINVKYRLDLAGKSYRATYSKSSSSYAKVQRLEQKYKAGSSALCFYDTSHPQDVILVRESLWSVLLILFPLPFLAFGALVLFIAFYMWKGPPEPVAGGRLESISARESWFSIRFRRGSIASRLGLTLFFSIFAVMGCGVFYAMFGSLGEMIDSKNWKQIPAVVESSRVLSHDSDDGTTYSVDILYRYEINGQAFKSNRYGFFSGSSSGFSAKQEVVDQYPVGRKITVFFNPKDPTAAVISRQVGAEWIIGIIPLIFILVGFGGMIHAWRGTSSKASLTTISAASEQTGSELVQESWLPSGGNVERLHSGEVCLKPLASPTGKVIGVLFMAVFWNGIISIFLYQAVEAFRHGRPEWVLMCFLMPFVLIGLALLAGVVYFVLAAFNPVPRLYLSKESFVLGETLELRWEFRGSVSRLCSLCISLKGSEEVEYRRGTTTYHDKREFYSATAVELGAFSNMQSGSTSFAIPKDSMHSFESSHNKISWKVNVHAEIAKWPDVNENFEILVLPIATGELGI